MNDEPTHAVPSITSFYFTGGKRYPLLPGENETAHANGLRIVLCDNGHKRTVAEGTSAHLWPPAEYAAGVTRPNLGSFEFVQHSSIEPT